MPTWTNSSKEHIMKKLISSLVIASMLVSTPAFAGGRDRGNHHESRGGGCGWLCGAIIGGIIVGTVASSDRRRDEDRRDYDNRYYPPNDRYDTRYCVREQVVEWRRGERYIYWQTTCN